MPSAPPDELLRLARRLARRYHVAGYERDDLVQEAYLAMLQAPPGATRRQLVSRARTRLYRLYLHACQGEAGWLPDGVAGPEGPGPDDLIDRLFELLPVRQARAVYLHFWLGVPDAEIGRRLGTTRWGVRQLRRRAYRRLREGMVMR